MRFGVRYLQMMLLSTYEYCKNRRRKACSSVGFIDLTSTMYRKTPRHFESKEPLGKIFVIRTEYTICSLGISRLRLLPLIKVVTRLQHPVMQLSAAVKLKLDVLTHTFAHRPLYLRYLLDRGLCYSQSRVRHGGMDAGFCPRSNRNH
jgi:hypothetical protein